MAKKLARENKSRHSGMPYWMGRSSLLTSGNLSFGTMSRASHSRSFSSSAFRITSPFSSSRRGARKSRTHLSFPRLPDLRIFSDAFLINDSKELFAHLTGLGLAFNFVAVYDTTAIVIRACTVAA